MAVKRWNGTAWEVYAGSDLAPVKVTDGRLGKTTFIGATTPTGMVDGDIWIDQDTATNAVVPTALLAKGDIFVATASGAYTRLAAGSNGELLYADSTTSTGLRWQGDYSVGKNKILNGDFSIWQRGTSFSSSGQYTADRWVCILNGTASRQQFTTGSAPVSGYEGQYYLNWTINANAQNAEMLQRIEDVRTFAGQTVTLSFWARSTAGAQPLNVAIYQNFGTGGSPSSMVPATLISGTSPYTPTSTWQRFSFTFSIPSISGKTLGTNNDHFLWVRTLQFTTTATNTSIDIWGVQLEAGSVATPFTTNAANPQAELAACQRYYWRATTDVTLNGIPSVGFASANSTTTANAWVRFPVSMRGNGPTSVDVANPRLYGGTTQYNPNTITLGNATRDQAQLSVTVTAGGLTLNQAYVFGHDNGAGSYVAFNAEL